jgi:hypothetical protein
MKYVVFKLEMPNNNSWNGKWSGEDKIHCIIKSYPYSKNKELSSSLKNVISAGKGSGYDFGDGWRAYVKISECTASEKKELVKKSAGFCGYDWMISDIEDYGHILTIEERKQLNNKKTES